MTDSVSLLELAKSDPEPTVTLPDGLVASKAVVNEIFGRVLSAAREWPGIRAVENLSNVAFNMDADASITDPLEARVLYKHQLITTPDVPVRRDQITGGPNGLTASVVVFSFVEERGQVRIVHPCQMGPR